MAIIPLTFRTLSRLCLLGTFLGFGGGLLRTFASCICAARLTRLGSRGKPDGRSSQGVSEGGVRDVSTCLVVRASDMIARISKCDSIDVCWIV